MSTKLGDIFQFRVVSKVIMHQLVAWAIILGTVVCGHAETQYSIDKITDDSYNEFGLQLNENGQIVWFRWDGNDFDIFFYNGTAIIQITDNSQQDQSPQINADGYIAWTGSDGSDSEIYLYNGTTTAQFTNNSHSDIAPQINVNGHIVWQGWDGSDYEIFYYNGKTTTQLTNNSYNDYSPQVNAAGHIVWLDGNGDYEILYYNGTTATQITDNSYNEFYPQINANGHIVWMGWDGSDYEIFYYNGITTTQITDNSYDDSYPQINDNEQIVWHGQDNSDWEIFHYNDATTIQLTNNALHDRYPDINTNGQIIWSRYEGNYQDILLATPIPTISAITPSSGLTSGGNSVTLSGETFGQAQGTVSFAGTNATITSWTDTQIICTTPATSTSVGSVDVVATNAAGGSATLTDGYTYYITYNLNSTAGAGGNITPSGTVTMPEGSSQTFNITPDTNYHIVDVTVNDNSVGPVPSYTFSNINADATISATFAINAPIVISFSPTSGHINGGTPATINGTYFGSTQGTGSVTFGSNAASITSWTDSQIVCIVPASSTSVGSVDLSVTNSLGESATLTEGFTYYTTYTLTASTNSGGSITPSGSVTVNNGASQSFTITPDSGYHNVDVTVNDSSVGPVSSYTFSNINADATIDATFAINQYTLTASAGSGGSISPSGSIGVDHGASQTFTITPGDGYHTVDVTVNDASVGAVSSHTLSSIDANATITATFAIDQYTLTASAGSGGNITPSGSMTVDHGSSQTFTITPDLYYTIADVTVNNTSIGTVSSHTLANISDDTTIAATFAFSQPTLSGMTPTSGTTAGSTTVTLTGSHFGTDQGNGTITFGGTTADITSWSDNQIVCTAPVHPAGLVSLTVTRDDGETATLTDAFTYASDTVPNLTCNATADLDQDGDVDGNDLLIYTSAQTIPLSTLASSLGSVCSPSSLGLCASQTTCQQNGGFWYEEACHTVQLTGINATANTPFSAFELNVDGIEQVGASDGWQISVNDFFTLPITAIDLEQGTITSAFPNFPGDMEIRLIPPSGCASNPLSVTVESTLAPGGMDPDTVVADVKQNLDALFQAVTDQMPDQTAAQTNQETMNGIWAVFMDIYTNELTEEEKAIFAALFTNTDIYNRLQEMRANLDGSPRQSNPTSKSTGVSKSSPTKPTCMTIDPTTDEYTCKSYLRWDEFIVTRSIYEATDVSDTLLNNGFKYITDILGVTDCVNKAPIFKRLTKALSIVGLVIDSTKNVASTLPIKMNLLNVEVNSTTLSFYDETRFTATAQMMPVNSFNTALLNLIITTQGEIMKNNVDEGSECLIALIQEAVDSVVSVLKEFLGDDSFKVANWELENIEVPPQALQIESESFIDTQETTCDGYLHDGQTLYVNKLVAETEGIAEISEEVIFRYPQASSNIFGLEGVGDDIGDLHVLTIKNRAPELDPITVSVNAETDINTPIDIPLPETDQECDPFQQFEVVGTPQYGTLDTSNLASKQLTYTLTSCEASGQSENLTLKGFDGAEWGQDSLTIDITGNIGPTITVNQGTTPVTNGGTGYNFEVGVAGEPQTVFFDIVNQGECDLHIDSIQVEGSNEFVVDTYGTAPIPPEGASSFSVTWTPPQNGLSSATVIISTNDLETPEFSFLLTAYSLGNYSVSIAQAETATDNVIDFQINATHPYQLTSYAFIVTPDDNPPSDNEITHANWSPITPSTTFNSYPLTHTFNYSDLSYGNHWNIWFFMMNEHGTISSGSNLSPVLYYQTTMSGVSGHPSLPPGVSNLNVTCDGDNLMMWWDNPYDCPFTFTCENISVYLYDSQDNYLTSLHSAPFSFYDFYFDYCAEISYARVVVSYNEDAGTAACCYR